MNHYKIQDVKDIIVSIRSIAREIVTLLQPASKNHVMSNYLHKLIEDEKAVNNQIEIAANELEMSSKSRRAILEPDVENEITQDEFEELVAFFNFLKLGKERLETSSRNEAVL